MENFNTGIAKTSVMPENPLFPKTSVFLKWRYRAMDVFNYIPVSVPKPPQRRLILRGQSVMEVDQRVIHVDVIVQRPGQITQKSVVVEGPVGGQSAGRDDDDLSAEGVVADDLDDAVTGDVREILVVQILTLDS